MVHLNYDVAVADYEAFNLNIVCGPGVRRQWWQQLAFSLIVWPALAGAYVAWDGGTPAEIARTAGLIFVLVLLFVGGAFAMYPRRVRKLLRRMLGSEPRETFLGPQRLEVGPDGVALEGGGVKAHYAWSAIDGLDETAEHLFLMTGKVHGIIIPKRALDASDLARLSACVRASIGGGCGA